MLIEAPHQLVKFRVYKREGLTAEGGLDRRLTRVKNKNKLPLGVWARSVLEGRHLTIVPYIKPQLLVTTSSVHCRVYQRTGFFIAYFY